MVRRSARAVGLVAARRLAAALVLAAVVTIPACGGDEDDAEAGKAPLAWKGSPVVRESPSGANVLVGEIENRSSAKLAIRAPQVRVLDAKGRRIASSAVFASAYVRSLFPHNRTARGRPEEYPEAEQERVGYLAVMDAGDDAPLTVSWQELRGRRAARVDLGPTSLPIPVSVGAG